MLIQPFSLNELEFAWCHRVYLCFGTHRRKPIEQLLQLDQGVISELLKSYGIHVLEISSDATDIRLLVSLGVQESVSSAASKVKGRLSKWLSDQVSGQLSDEKQKWFSRGYFAATTGKSASQQVADYFDRQAEHHGYDRRILSPVFVQQYEISDQDMQCLAPEHAVALLRYHLVLATQWRHGVFSPVSASEVVGQWRANQGLIRAVIQKVSFLPDHVHIAVQTHPATSPSAIAEFLMNSSQELMWDRFEGDVIRARLNRLWQASAYVGSFGELRSSAIAAYIRNWHRTEE